MDRKHNINLRNNARELRKEMTKEERHLWYDFLRSYPVKFNRQKILGKYIVDFYSASAKLVIEIDGSQHYLEEGRLYDKQRTEYLEKYNLKVVRIPNGEINNNFEGICRYIDSIVKSRL
ncbi:MAG: endonuclease domain-containing protein [Ruminococcus sp.]